MTRPETFHGRDFRGAIITFGPGPLVTRPPDRPQAWLADLDRRIRHFETACVATRGQDTWTSYDAAWRRLTPVAGGIAAALGRDEVLARILAVSRRGVAA